MEVQSHSTFFSVCFIVLVSRQPFQTLSVSRVCVRGTLEERETETKI